MDTTSFNIIECSINGIFLFNFIAKSLHDRPKFFSFFKWNMNCHSLVLIC